MLNDQQRNIVKVAVALLAAQVQRQSTISFGLLIEAFERAGMNYVGAENPLHGVTYEEIEKIIGIMDSQGRPNMDKKVENDWEEFFSFLRQLLDDSSHAGDEETYEWAQNKIHALEEIVFDA